MRIALGLEYDGRRFCGWQSQPSGCAVQDALERSLASICGQFVRVAAAGRTDTGVHATAQVAHFDAPVERPLSAWVRGVNSELPDAVAVLWAQPVAPEFHARFSAIGRRYTYLLLNRASRPGLASGRVGWFHRPLDLSRMRTAASMLLGRHDFSAFRAAECQAESASRELRSLDIEREGDLIVLRFAADAFLQRMVRNIVGSLVYVGKGKHPPQWVAAVLAGRDRCAAAPTFAPDGLYLTGVDYAPEWGLATPPTREPHVTI